MGAPAECRCDGVTTAGSLWQHKGIRQAASLTKPKHWTGLCVWGWRETTGSIPAAACWQALRARPVACPLTGCASRRAWWRAPQKADLRALHEHTTGFGRLLCTRGLAMYWEGLGTYQLGKLADQGGQGLLPGAGRLVLHFAGALLHPLGWLLWVQRWLHAALPGLPQSMHLLPFLLPCCQSCCNWSSNRCNCCHSCCTSGTSSLVDAACNPTLLCQAMCNKIAT